MKTRIIRKYHPYCGTWWELWIKVWFIWVKSPYIFDSYKTAFDAQFYELRELFEKPIKTIETKRP